MAVPRRADGLPAWLLAGDDLEDLRQEAARVPVAHGQLQALQVGEERRVALHVVVRHVVADAAHAVPSDDGTPGSRRHSDRAVRCGGAHGDSAESGGGEGVGVQRGAGAGCLSAGGRCAFRGGATTTSAPTPRWWPSAGVVADSSGTSAWPTSPTCSPWRRGC